VNRLLVTGSREYADASEVARVLDRILYQWGELTLVHGGAMGADQLADWWGQRRANRGVTVEVEVWKANWAVCEGPRCTAVHRKTNRAGQQFCPEAGVRRNALMVGSGIDFAVAFSLGTPGTAHCIREIKRSGIPGVRYPEGQPL
jgi:YspA, cpYpsA-related SLOG family